MHVEHFAVFSSWLQPSSPHLPKSDNHTMIVYKQSDIVWDSIYPDLAKSPNQRLVNGNIQFSHCGSSSGPQHGSL